MLDLQKAGNIGMEYAFHSLFIFFAWNQKQFQDFKVSKFRQINLIVDE